MTQILLSIILFFQFGVAPQKPLRCQDFCVESLSSAEIEGIAEAKKKLDKAQANYDAAVSEARIAHGQPVPQVGNLGTCYPYDSVEIRGKYALITYVYQSCTSW